MPEKTAPRPVSSEISAPAGPGLGSLVHRRQLRTVLSVRHGPVDGGGIDLALEVGAKARFVGADGGRDRRSTLMMRRERVDAAPPVPDLW